MREFFEKNNYPANKEYILKNSLRRVSDWIFYEKEVLEVKFRDVREKEKFRSMLPFAGTKDERLIACFCEESDNRVYIVDTSEKVWFVLNEYESIHCWIRNILRVYVVNNILQKKSSKTLREIGELFYDIKEFARRAETVDIINNSMESYWFGKFGPYFDINFFRKNKLKIKDGFSIMFKSDLFNIYEWDKMDDLKYKKEGWKEILEKIWIPDYFLAFGGFILEGIDLEKYSRKILKLNNTLDEEGRKFNINEEEFRRVKGIRFRKCGLSERIFLETKNYYIFYEEGIAD